MGIGNGLVMSSAVDDEGIGGARNTLGWLLVHLNDFRSGDKILTLTASGRVAGGTRKLSPGPARRQAEVGDQRVDSSAESVDIVVGIVLLENPNGADEVLLESAQEVDDQSVLTNDLTERKVSLVFGRADREIRTQKCEKTCTSAGHPGTHIQRRSYQRPWQG